MLTIGAFDWVSSSFFSFDKKTKQKNLVKKNSSVRHFFDGPTPRSVAKQLKYCCTVFMHGFEISILVIEVV